MTPAIVPELAVRDWPRSRAFYTQVLGFDVLYERPDEGFSYLQRESAQLMIDAIDLGRTFLKDELRASGPLGLGMNLQIETSSLAPILAGLEQAGIAPVMPPERKTYRVSDAEVTQTQVLVRDPDGYLLRFFERG